MLIAATPFAVMPSFSKYVFEIVDRTVSVQSIGAYPLKSIGPTDGTAIVGETLKAGSLLPDGATVNYQWQESSGSGGEYSDIPSATSDTYVLTGNQLGKYVRVVVTGFGSYSGTVNSERTGPVIAAPLVSIGHIDGSIQVGQVLTAGELNPEGATATYRWRKSSTAEGTYQDIPGATNVTYQIVASDVGMHLKVVATGTNGYTGTVTSEPAGPVPAIPIAGIGEITGTIKEGYTLAAGAVTPAAATVLYQWLSATSMDGDYEEIPGATGSQYLLLQSDIGRYIKVRVTGTGSYSGVVTSVHVGPIALNLISITAIGNISGEVQVGHTLYAGGLTPSLATAAFQWEISAVPEGPYTVIPGATSTMYTPVAGDLGTYLRVTATGTGGYTGMVTSPAVGPISNGQLMGVGDITGTVANQNTIAAGPVTPAGATVTYQWQTAASVDGPFSDIGGATASTYLVIYSDYDQYLRVAVTGTGIYAGTVYSLPVGPVIWNPIQITAMGPVCGVASVGNTLEVGVLTPANSTATYQWFISDTAEGSYEAIAGSTGSTYTIIPANLGKYLKIEATGLGEFIGVHLSSAVGPVMPGQITAIGPIVGAAEVAREVTAGPLTPAAATATYRWMRANTPGGLYLPIDGATGNAYVLTLDDLGKYLKVEATGIGMYSGTALSAYLGPVVLITTPITGIGAIAGTPRVAGVLTAGAVTPPEATVTYQWKWSATAGGAYQDIPGAASYTYTVASAYLNRYIMLVVTGSGAYTGTASAGPIGPIGAGQLVNVGAVTGTVADGYTITAGLVTPAGATVAYQWQRGDSVSGPWTDIYLATTDDYDVDYNDYAKWLRVAVTGTGSYAGTVYSIPVGPVEWHGIPITAMGPMSGVPAVGNTLTAGTLTPANSTATYRWYVADTAGGTYVAIAGATSTAYTVVPVDLGKYLKVEVTGLGAFSGVLTSDAVGPVTAGQITAIGDIIGATEVGNELNAGPLTPVSATATYQWKRSNTPGGVYAAIPGATYDTYVPSMDDLGKYLKVEATGTGVYIGAATSNFAGPVVTVSTPITGIGSTAGTPQVAQTLIAGSITPSGATVTYQWKSSPTADGIYENIAGAVSFAYTVVPADLGKYLRVTATGSGAYTGSVTGDVVGPVSAAQLVSIGAITGTVADKYTITAGPVIPAGADVTYQWQRGDTVSGPWMDIYLATTDDYDINYLDYAKWLRVAVTGTGSYAGTVYSVPVGPVEWHGIPITAMGPVSGVATVGNTLVAGTLTPADSTATYQWFRSSTSDGIYEAIGGAISTTYAIVPADLGKFLKIEATGLGAFSGVLKSDAVGPVTAGQITAIGDIIGAAEVGNELYVGSLTPVGALATYQWKRSNTAGGVYVSIPGATYNTYVPSMSDLGKYLKVEATGMGAYIGTVTSNFSGPVVTVSTPITAIGPIGGMAQVAQMVVAGQITPSAATVTYQWESSTTADGIYGNIAGATSSIYTIAGTELGKYIRVKATGAGAYSGTVTSNALGPISAALLVSVGNITGSTVEGYILTAGTVTPAGADVTYQWQRGTSASGPWENISLATTNDYHVMWQDPLKWLRVAVTGTGSYTGTVYSQAVGPVAYHPTPITEIGPIAGVPAVSNTLTAGSILPVGAVATYQWLRSDAADGSYQPIGGGTSTSYVAAAADYGKYLKVEATGLGVYSGTVRSAAVGPVTMAQLTGIGNIVGSAQVGNVLSAGPLSPVGATATYQWLRADTVDGEYAAIEGETSDTYVPSAEDVDKYLKVQATATGAYAGTVTSNPTGPVVTETTPITAIGSIEGTPQVLETLSAGAVLPEGATVTYQWKWSSTENGIYQNIPGAASSTYTIVPGDVGKYVRVAVSGSGTYMGTATSEPVGPVTPATLTGVGDIIGTPAQYQTLTAGEVTPSGATVTYQWQRAESVDGEFVDISGAVTKSYDIMWLDPTKWLRVVVTGTGGYTGTVYSNIVSPTW